MPNDLENRITQLEQEIRNLKNSALIPFEVDSAFRERLGLSGIPLASLSNKNVDSEDVTVNESGSGSYAVMNDPVGFLKITVDGTSYYVPYFNA